MSRPENNKENNKENNRNIAIAKLIKSIANEEQSLGNILYQEGRKIEKALTLAKCIDDLVKVDTSVQKTVKEVAKAELLLLEKFEEAGELLCKDCIC